LLSYAKDKGINAKYIPIETFDAFLLRVWRNIENKPNELNARVQKSQLTEINIPLPEHGSGHSLIRLNALPLPGVPKSCVEVKFKENTDRDKIREIEGKYIESFIASRTSPYYCWGKLGSIKKAFDGLLVSCEVIDLPQEFFMEENLFLKGFFENAFTKSLARNLPLLSRFTRNSAWLIVDPHSENKSQLAPLFDVVGRETGEIPGLFTEIDQYHSSSEKVTWSEALRVSIHVKDGRSWLVVDPDIWIWPIRARKIAVSFMDERRRNRYNKKYCEILEAWINVIFDDQKSLICTPFSGGEIYENPVFILYKRTAYSKRVKV
jgi:hypothetical protein